VPGVGTLREIADQKLLDIEVLPVTMVARQERPAGRPAITT